MNEGMNSSEEGLSSEESQQKRKSAWVNALIFAAIFVLSIVLPPEYKPFVPILFVIPLIIALVGKVRQIRKKNEPSVYVSEQDHAGEPFSYTPKDPNDPRRYKPIG
ncbi:MAG: hypothetical protein JXA73_15130 [Acidobacteria bacterium]|nr:hypothetical protein [Acidobacteriota bacterium]